MSLFPSWIKAPKMSTKNGSLAYVEVTFGQCKMLCNLTTSWQGNTTDHSKGNMEGIKRFVLTKGIYIRLVGIVTKQVWLRVEDHQKA